MNDPLPNDSPSLSNKIARLAEERGWNQEEFARMAGLNRQTVRQILQEGGRTLRNSTVSSCAKALGVSVNDLRMLPLDKLLAKSHTQDQLRAEGAVPSLLERATQPELIAWVNRNPERAGELSSDEIEELLDLQQETGGPLVTFGVEHFVEAIERKRRLIEQVHAIAGTEYIDFLEQFVNMVYDRIQPYRDRT